MVKFDKYLFSILFFSIFLSCQNSDKKIIGLDCFQKGKKQAFQAINNDKMKRYRHLKDSIFKLPHAPLHKSLKGPQTMTFIGIYNNKAYDSLKAQLKGLKSLQRSRLDSLGFHGLLKTSKEEAYVFIKPTDRNPLLFLVDHNQQGKAQGIFKEEDYFTRKISCN